MNNPLYPHWPPQPGDIFFVRGNDWLAKVIMWFQSLYAKDKRSDWSHTGVFVDGENVLETTPGLTQVRSFARNYAGSQILILRWIGMTPENHYWGLCAVADQMGLDYPEGVLLAFALGWQEHAKTDSGALVCSQLAATDWKGAGFPLGHKPEYYSSDTLPKELLSHLPSGGVLKVFEGSMRQAGLVRGSGEDNELVV
jgi:hypothetical protein